MNGLLEGWGEPEAYIVSLADLPTDEDLIGPEPSAAFVDSVERYGVLNPVTLVRKGESFVVAAGRRRIKAARAVGLEEIPASVYNEGEAEVSIIALVENEQRTINYAGQLQAVLDLRERGASDAEICEAIGIGKNRLRSFYKLDRLIPPLRERMFSGKARESVARAASRLSEREQEQLAEIADADEKLVMRQVREVRQVSREATQETLPDRMFETPQAEPDDPTVEAAIARIIAKFRAALNDLPEEDLSFLALAIVEFARSTYGTWEDFRLLVERKRI